MGIYVEEPGGPDLGSPIWETRLGVYTYGGNQRDEPKRGELNVRSPILVAQFKEHDLGSPTRGTRRAESDAGNPTPRNRRGEMLCLIPVQAQLGEPISWESKLRSPGGPTREARLSGEPNSGSPTYGAELEDV